MAKASSKSKDKAPVPKEPRPIIINFNVFVSDSTIDDDEEIEKLMAKIDEVQASFDELDAAIRELLANVPTSVSNLQRELDTLRADDAIEDTKLDAMQNGIGNLVGAIQSFRDRADEVLPGSELPVVDQPYPDQSLPQPQPHPDQTLPGDLPQQ